MNAEILYALAQPIVFLVAGAALTWFGYKMGSK